jgi:hypothetical protein
MPRENIKPGIEHETSGEHILASVKLIKSFMHRRYVNHVQGGESKLE